MGIYMLYAGVLFVLQRQIMYPGQYLNAPADPPIEAQRLEQMWIAASDARSEVWLRFPESDGKHPAPVVIVAHGNAELIDGLPRQLAPFHRMGIAVALVEYPGYGRSEGNPSQDSIGKVFRKVYDRLAGRPDVDASRIFAYGRSVGGGVVCQLAADRPLAALLLQSTFTRTSSFAHEFFLPGFLVRDQFDNEAVLQDYPHPVLIVHGRRDRQVPFSHAERLAEVAPKARLIEYDCGHNDCPPRWDIFWQDVRAFLQRHRLLRQTG